MHNIRPGLAWVEEQEVKFVIFCLSALILSGCFSKPVDNIPSIAQDHPANKFYQFVSQNPVTDRVCRDHKGDPSIPMGEISKGEKYERANDLVPGAFRFKDKTSGKKYLGVSYLQYQGFLQIPKLCSWEE